MTLTNKLTNIANAIREKTNLTEPMTLDEMPDNLKNIKTGSNNLFDIKLSDHVLTGNELTGWGLQGTYTSSAYTGFYNKCLEEYNTASKKTLYMPCLSDGWSIIGTTKLNNKDMILSNFGDGKCLTTTSSYYTGEYVCFRVRFSSITGTEYLFNSLHQSYGILFASTKGVPTLYASANGTSWNFSNAVKPTSSSTTQSANNVFKDEENLFTTFEIDKWYTIEISSQAYANDGSILNCYITPDGEESLPCIQVVSETLSLLNNPKLDSFSCNFGDGWTTASTGSFELDLKNISLYLSENPHCIDKLDYQQSSNKHNYIDLAVLSTNNLSAEQFINKLFTITKSAWFYGIDTVNERILLPKTSLLEQPTDIASDVGNLIEAGLPNILGRIEYHVWATNRAGAFYNGGGTKRAGASTSDSGGVGATALFDASRYDSIYGNSETVQPPSIQRLIYICVGNTTINTNYIDIAKEELVQQAITGVNDVTTTTNSSLETLNTLTTNLMQQIQSKADDVALSEKVNINSNVIDGQWISHFKQLSTATAIGSYTVDLSSELPNDDCQYDVLFGFTVGNSNATAAGIVLKTDIINSFTSSDYINGLASANCYYTNTNITMPVGAGRYCIYEIIGHSISLEKTNRGLFMLGYRRIGTNQ